MADPLRRTILAKLRGKKPKGRDASRAREGKEKVFHTQTERGCVSDEMRGERSCVAADPGLGLSWSAVAGASVTGGRANALRSRVSQPGGPAVGLHTLGDSIGFGACHLTPKTEPLKRADGRDIKCKETNVTLLEQKAEENITGDSGRIPKPSEASHVLYDESDLIQVIESSLEYHGDFRMPALQSPTFFPTELEITSGPGLKDGAPRHHSLDSEDDDYYDNQILPFYESAAQSHSIHRDRSVVELSSGQTSASGSNESAQETDRLKSQLKEAYYLLINTMHNISFEGQDNGFVDQGSSASQSHDSVSSQSSDKHTGSDVCSSEEQSGPIFGSLFTALGRCGVGLTGSSQSRSLQDILKVKSKPTLQRSVSDSRVKYSLGEPVPSQHEQQASRHDPSHPEIPPPPASAPKNPGVTVNKMQEWMQKGRVLSSEMKQRIAGSSTRPRAVAMESTMCHRQAPFNHITVSKKRNWLQQSSGRSAEDVPPSAAEEENDADDEGEIWYNPIPEEEEAESCPAGADARKHSTGDTPQPGHRHTGPSKTPDDSLRATDPPEQSTGGFSPSSSPNPAKRSTTITWSFPDKIKSPRTVRKLSMKMKKLPDLSRKLSVKGNPPANAPISNGQSESRAHLPRANGMAELASGNVIWRYHLDSSVSTQHSFDKRKSNTGGVPKSASKGGYLSDGDSPELVAKSGKHGSSERKSAKSRDPNGNGGSPKLPGTELDIDAFRSYSFSEQPKCLSYISGLMSLHFYGAEDLKPPRVDSRDVYFAIQVDSVNKARTALLTCRTAFLDMDHTFNIELENAQQLKLVVFSWESTPRRNRVCGHGTVVLPGLFRASRTQQLAVRLEPRGMIYVKLSLMEQRQNSPDGDQHSQVFGVEAQRVVEREASGLMVPLIIEKCITEIERRGCQVVGLYRLCGSAAVKKELREAFERDSHAVQLSENNYPDINVITGVLKDYLRELPHPLITKPLYESVLEAMLKRPLLMGASGCENEPDDTEHALSLLELLPHVQKATLRKLLDHLKRVASHHELNKMTCQNLAVCFGPVLLSQRQDASSHGKRVFIDSEELASALHFKKHIEVLHYLLQLWPVVDVGGKSPSPAAVESVPAVRRRKERPQVLNLSEADVAGVLRPRAGRLDSPSNRYAGDWSGCRENYLQQTCPEEADYDDVPSEEPLNTGPEELPKGTGEVVSEQELPELDKATDKVEEMQTEEEESEEEEDTEVLDRLHVEEPLSISPCDEILPDLEEHRPKEHTYQAYMKIQEISPVLSNRVNLRDLQESIDALIGNLERELNKNKLNIGY